MPEPEVIVAPATEAVVADPAPATDPTEAVVADPAPAPVTEDQDPSDESQPTKPSKVVSELIAQRKKRQDAEREAAYWKGVAEGRGKPDSPSSVETPPSTATPTAPKLDQFETYEQYEVAKDEYLLQTAEHRAMQRMQAAQAAQTVQTVEQTFQKRIDAAVAEDPTLVDVLRDPTLPISVHMIPVLKESENAPKLLRWLDQNREEARRIATLPPLQAARAMGMVEAKISFAPVVEPPKRVSSAPEPVKAVATTSSAVVDEDTLPMEEYHKRRTAKLTGRQ
jgi:hypothetical protein